MPNEIEILTNNFKKEFTPEAVSLSGFKIVYAVWQKIVLDAGEKTFPKFSKKFQNGFCHKPSFRKSKQTKTISDNLIDLIIKERVPKFTKKDIDLIRFGHRISMAAENILGLILEEYIHTNVVDHGWACCWGNCIPAVDFCSSSGQLLQVKNRSNTENSSSNKIRNNTEIMKWYRVDAATGKTHWVELNKIIGVNSLLSEESFINFTKALIRHNPNAINIDDSILEHLFAN